jgi:Ca2+-binding EF-hand superfamily protein
MGFVGLDTAEEPAQKLRAWLPPAKVKVNRRASEAFVKDQSTTKSLTTEQVIAAVRTKMTSRAKSDNDVVRRMVQLFRKYDSNSDNMMDLTELKQCMRMFFSLNLTDNQARALMNHLDTNGDGSLDTHEFLVGFVGLDTAEEPAPPAKVKINRRASEAFVKDQSTTKSLTTEQVIAAVRTKITSRAKSDNDVVRRMAQLFRKYDSNNDNMMDLTELKQCMRMFFSLNLTDDQARALMNHLDTNGDGSLDTHEFLVGFVGLNVAVAHGGASQGEESPDDRPRAYVQERPNEAMHVERFTEYTSPVKPTRPSQPTSSSSTSSPCRTRITSPAKTMSTSGTARRPDPDHSSTGGRSTANDYSGRKSGLRVSHSTDKTDEENTELVRLVNAKLARQAAGMTRWQVMQHIGDCVHARLTKAESASYISSFVSTITDSRGAVTPSAFAAAATSGIFGLKLSQQQAKEFYGLVGRGMSSTPAAELVRAFSSGAPAPTYSRPAVNKPQQPVLGRGGDDDELEYDGSDGRGGDYYVNQMPAMNHDVATERRSFKAYKQHVAQRDYRPAYGAGAWLKNRSTTTSQY